MKRKKNRNYNTQKNNLTKEYFSDMDRVSDFLNGTLYDGKRIIQPEELQIMDSVQIAKLMGKTFERRRDVLIKSTTGDKEEYYGIENQTNIHKFMPLRILIYDSIVEMNLTKSKENKVPAVTSVVFYTGKYKWKKPLKLKDCIEINKETEKYHGNIEIKVAWIKEEYSFKNKDNINLFKLVQFIYNGQELNEGDFNKVNLEVVRLAGYITNTEELINYEGKGEIDMCKEWEDLKKKVAIEARKDEREKVTKIERERSIKQAETTLNETIVALYKEGCAIDMISRALKQNIEYVNNIVSSSNLSQA